MELNNKKNFDALCRRHKYWNNSRWAYHEKAMEWAKELNPGSVLEIGPNQFPIYLDSTVMSKHKEDKPDVLHFAEDIPWPFEDGQFDLMIALQVWEHVKTPRASFFEAKRVAKNFIFSFPYKWDCGHDNVHHMLDERWVADWTDGAEIKKKIIIAKRMVCLI